MKTHFLRIRGLVPVMVGAWTALAGLICTTPASAQSSDRLGNLVRSEFSRPRTVTGIGLVTGLDGTGDTGKNLASARLYAEMLRRSGAVDETDLPQDILKAGGIALVTVTATIQVVEQGGRYVPCTVAVAGGGASSLAGGRLWVTPLRENVSILGVVDPEDQPSPFAFAQGPLSVEEDQPTVATISGPASGAFVLPTSGADERGRYSDFYDSPAFRGRREVLFDFRIPAHGTNANAQRIVDAINEELMEDGFTDLASIASETGVLVRLPEVEDDAFRFAARIENIPVDFASVIEVPARIDWDPKSGVLAITGNAQLHNAHVSIEGFQLSRVEPRREPTLDNPDITLESGVILSGRQTPSLMLSEFRSQLNKLQVPAQKQAEVLRLLCDQGMVNAEFHEAGAR
jgi:flagellar P-ring protein precursor FlgI